MHEILKHYIPFHGANWRLTEKGQLQSEFSQGVGRGSVKIISSN